MASANANATDRLQLLLRCAWEIGEAVACQRLYPGELKLGLLYELDQREAMMDLVREVKGGTA
jgi:hypothetical protein